MEATYVSEKKNEPKTINKKTFKKKNNICVLYEMNIKEENKTSQLQYT